MVSMLCGACSLARVVFPRPKSKKKENQQVLETPYASVQHRKGLVNHLRTAVSEVLEFVLQHLRRYALSLVLELCRAAVAVDGRAADAGPER